MKIHLPLTPDHLFSSSQTGLLCPFSTFFFTNILIHSLKIPNFFNYIFNDMLLKFFTMLVLMI